MDEETVGDVGVDVVDLEVEHVADGLLVHNSIYAFRGADIRNILEFEEAFPDSTVVVLEQNYRSTQSILDAANAVIAKNLSRKPKDLWTDAEMAEIRVISFERAFSRGVGACSDLNSRVSWSDHAIRELHFEIAELFIPGVDQVHESIFFALSEDHTSPCLPSSATVRGNGSPAV